MERKYPCLEINRELFRKNTREVIKRCSQAGISIAGVTKGYASLPELAKILQEEGAAQIASSRLEQIEACRRAGLKGPFMLLRIPMPDELEELAGLCEYSLQSDLSVMRKLDEICTGRGIKHSVVVMKDLGDLREGFWDREEMIAVCEEVEHDMDGLNLAGIGVNLGCYGSIEPTEEKMNELIELAEDIEARIGRKLEIISGGATSTFVLLHKGKLPSGINHLRIGEAIEQPMALKNVWGLKDLDYLSDDVFMLKAQILEVRDKPSHPVGRIFIDAFENTPEYEDRGIRKRALAGIGKLDYGTAAPPVPVLEGTQLLGASSDHTILDIEDCKVELKPGDVVSFRLPYAAILYLTFRPDIKIKWI